MARANTKPAAPAPQGVRAAGGAAPAAAVNQAVTDVPPVPGVTPPGGETAQAADAESYALGEGDILVIKAIDPNGFRRAGRRWSGEEETAVRASDFTAPQLAALLAEPQLEVRVEACTE